MSDWADRGTPGVEMMLQEDVIVEWITRVVQALLVIDGKMPEFALFSLENHLFYCIPWWRSRQDIELSLLAGSPGLQNIPFSLTLLNWASEYPQWDPALQINGTHQLIFGFFLSSELCSLLKER